MGQQSRRFLRIRHLLLPSRPSSSTSSSRGAPPGKRSHEEASGGRAGQSPSPSRTLAIATTARAQQESSFTAKGHAQGIQGEGATAARRRRAKEKASPDLVSEAQQQEKAGGGIRALWSRADELRILEAMTNHVNTHRSTLWDTCRLFAALASSLDKRDTDLPDLADKVHKRKRWYGNACLQQRSRTDDDNTR
uniref:Glabrous enhancer-binding protein-like DBD domain-containing protein n=1 Tax=Oryza glumipatula TaxID=40148 RepID=A0A0E0B0V9_9ORYZ